MFISIDGIDGAGKSTQIALLKEWLLERGRCVDTFRDPGATALGESIREILLHREDIPLSMRAEMLLYMSARAQLVEEQIKPALAAQRTVICDRYLLANVVYQGSAGGLPTEALWSVGNLATGGLRPDVTVVLDLDAEIALQRLTGSRDRLEKRGLAYFQKVRQGFRDQHSLAGPHSVVVDANQAIPQVQQRIRDFISQIEGASNPSA